VYTGFWWVLLGEKGDLEDLGRVWRIILKNYFQEYNLSVE
jgi:hypothetical protein